MVLIQLAFSTQHTMLQNTPSFSSRQECTLVVQPHAMHSRKQCMLFTKYTTLLLSHMKFTQLALTLYKHQRQLNFSPDYVSWQMAKIIPSSLANIVWIYTQQTNSGIKLRLKYDKPRDQYQDLISPQTQMCTHQYRYIINISQGNIWPRNPICPVTAGPQKLNHAKDQIQKRLFCWKDRSENLGKE